MDKAGMSGDDKSVCGPPAGSVKRNTGTCSDTCRQGHLCAYAMAPLRLRRQHSVSGASARSWLMLHAASQAQAVVGAPVCIHQGALQGSQTSSPVTSLTA